ncbi:MAG: hypothetical protein MZV49_08925 [Rhodopseudomonas palustris]|nr:hypothetical protein [Rhodopseudomonas palustris]
MTRTFTFREFPDPVRAVYVDHLSGSDDNQGTYWSPYKRIQHAVDVAAALHDSGPLVEVRVVGGAGQVYPTPDQGIRIKDGVLVRGGYQPGSTMHDPGFCPVTVLNSNPIRVTGPRTPDSPVSSLRLSGNYPNGARVEYLTINGPDGVACSAGVSIVDATSVPGSVVIARCSIIAGKGTVRNQAVLALNAIDIDIGSADPADQNLIDGSGVAQETIGLRAQGSRLYVSRNVIDGHGASTLRSTGVLSGPVDASVFDTNTITGGYGIDGSSGVVADGCFAKVIGNSVSGGVNEAGSAAPRSFGIKAVNTTAGFTLDANTAISGGGAAGSGGGPGESVGLFLGTGAVATISSAALMVDGGRSDNAVALRISGAADGLVVPMLQAIGRTGGAGPATGVLVESGTPSSSAAAR